MKDTWYADQRDIVKWGTLAHLAMSHSLDVIVQVAYLRPGKRPPLSTRTGEIPIVPPVWAFFRDVSAVGRLGESLGRRILVIDQPFAPQHREAYREAVVAILRGERSSKVVLLDPDTGIAPRKPSGKHVTTDDIQAAWEVLRPGDWLVIYQHRSRQKDWKEKALHSFAEVCRVSVHVYEAPKIASDVILLAAKKS